MKVKYKVVKQKGTGKAIIVSDKDIKKGEKFLYNLTEIIVAKNDINVHDNSTHYKIVDTKIVQIALNDLNVGDTFQVKFRGRVYTIHAFVKEVFFDGLPSRRSSGNSYVIAMFQKTMYAFYYDKIVYYERKK